MEATYTMGKILKILRIANGYTTQEAANAAQVGHSYISIIESGKRKASDIVFEKLAVFYRLSYRQIMDLLCYYQNFAGSEKMRYQYTLAKALEMLMNLSRVEVIRATGVYKILRIAREANHMTQEIASNISGVSKIYIHELEGGKKENISAAYLEKLADAYNLSTHQVFELADYYENLKFDEDRRLRLTLIETLKMIDKNLES